MLTYVFYVKKYASMLGILYSICPVMGTELFYFSETETIFQKRKNSVSEVGN